MSNLNLHHRFVKFIFGMLFLGMGIGNLQAQKTEYEIACVGFYNLENLFDTIVDPDTNKILQADFTPFSEKNWNTQKYYEKLGNIAQVISEIGKESTPDGAAVLGVCEIENKSVLEDLIKQKPLVDRNYGIVHYESPDHRGIDVGFIYQPKYFKVLSSKPYALHLTGEDRFTTREQLLVSGELLGEKVHFIVVHWPSRRGGEKKSSYKREAAAELALHIMDSIRKEEPSSKVMLMGDLNDDPNSPSIKKVLKVKTKQSATFEGNLFNPMSKLHQQGIGSHAYRNVWSLIDQMIMTHGFIDNEKKYETWSYYNSLVYNKTYLTNKDGNFKGYPFRTYVGATYQGGYSDHFPVYTFLLRQKK